MAVKRRERPKSMLMILTSLIRHSIGIPVNEFKDKDKNSVVTYRKSYRYVICKVNSGVSNNNNSILNRVGLLCWIL